MCAPGRWYNCRVYTLSSFDESKCRICSWNWSPYTQTDVKILPNPKYTLPIPSAPQRLSQLWQMDGERCTSLMVFYIPTLEVHFQGLVYIIQLQEPNDPLRIMHTREIYTRIVRSPRTLIYFLSRCLTFAANRMHSRTQPGQHLAARKSQLYYT